MASDLVERVLRTLGERAETLSTAESLTAGMVSSALADVAGASLVLRGGVTVYATDLKVSVLGVSADTVERFGVVSSVCAAEMAARVRVLLGTDWAVSTTGVAGPDPQDGIAAGTVFVGVAGPGRGDTRELHLEGSREQVRRGSVDAVLRLLLESLADRLTDVPVERDQGSAPCAPLEASGDHCPPAADDRSLPLGGGIRTKAFGVVVNRGGTHHAVWRGRDPQDGSEFHRLLGGKVEFGELAVDAVARELDEELGIRFGDPRLLTVLENVFMFDGRPGHEVVFVYTGLVDRPDVVPPEGAMFDDVGDPIRVEWRRIDAAGETLPLYPNGLQRALDALAPGWPADRRSG